MIIKFIYVKNISEQNTSNDKKHYWIIPAVEIINITPYWFDGPMLKMVRANTYILKHHFEGLPKASDLELIKEELPPLKDGGKYLPFVCVYRFKISCY